ncbi:golgi apparatus membrane protein Tvp15p [Trichomonascus vanleenenianus]|uniref:Tvp15p n=1 Tax=Trichomonascus vanleenenianus TaxID=2268995 RepID=UPI003ECAFECE
MDFSNVFRIVNLAVGALSVLGGISQFFPVSFQSTIIAIYVILFGLGIVAMEFRVPTIASRYASFLFSFIGRGLFYVFIGTIILHDHVLRIIAGSIIGVIGVLYIVLEFIPSVEPPENMRLGGLDEYENATETV